jgi:hypothetical protein
MKTSLMRIATLVLTLLPGGCESAMRQGTQNSGAVHMFERERVSWIPVPLHERRTPLLDFWVTSPVRLGDGAIFSASVALFG